MKQVVLFLFFFIISIALLENHYSLTYLESLKTEAVFAIKENDPLYHEILEKKEDYEEPPVNAIIDPIWKAVPGYNGIEINVDASYKKMKKKNRFNKNDLVFKEVRPDITLDDLDPSPIYKGNSKKAMVAFQINVAWGNEYIPEVLKILKKHDIKATFFLDGSWTKKNPRLAKMIADDGHEIGNHAYSHPDMKQLSNDKIREELTKTNKIIVATTGQTPKWFAPPSGSYRDDVVDIAADLNMKTVLWTVDTVDWKSPNPAEMSYRVVQKIHRGAMVLMHPTKPTAEGLERMITGIQEKGFKIGTVSELLSEKRLRQ